MIIDKIQTMNFMGLKGKKEWTPGKINILCQPNRCGKSSFMKAVKYGITGETTGSIITEGADCAAVGLTLHHNSGNASIIRAKSAGGTTSFYLDKKKSTKKMVDQTLEECSGVPMKAIRLATSEDALKAVKPQEFEDLILSYTNETVDLPTLEALVPDLTESMKKELEGRLTGDEFGMPSIDAFYKKIDEDRLTLKRAILEKEKVLKDLEAIRQPKETKAALEAKENKLREAMVAVAAYKDQMIAYEKAKQARESQDKTIAEYKAKVAASKAVKRDPEQYAALKKAFEEKTRMLNTQQVSVEACRKAIADTEHVIKNLQTPYCPLSDKLTCTTDKTKVRAELDAALASMKQSQAASEQTMKALQLELRDLEIKIRDSDKEAEEYRQKEFLAQEIAKLEKQRIELPPQPKKPDTADAPAQMDMIRKQLFAWEQHERAARLREQLQRGRLKLSDFEKLAQAFSPKGIVKERLIARYMQAFEEVCNEKAKLLHPGMKVRFLSSSGVHVLIDTKGDNHFLKYEALSGAEQALYIYLILDLLNTLSGMRILMIDELSVLDSETFRALLQIVMTHQEDYDHIFLSFVNHSDTVSVLKSFGLDNNISL